MTPVIPSLTIDGWDTNPVSQMSKLWEYYQASDYSQSNLFMGSVVSLKKTLQTFTNPDRLAEQISKDIYTLYGEHFDHVEPLTEVKPNQDGTVSINVDIIATRGFDSYRLSQSIKGRNSGIIEYETKLIKQMEYIIE